MPGHFGHHALMVGHIALRALGLAVLAVCSVACGSDASSATTDRLGASTSVKSSLVGQTSLTDVELSELLAVAVPAAIAANPDGRGKIVATDYPIADSLGSVSGDSSFQSVTFDGNETPLPQGARTAISAAVAPGSAVFVPADLAKGMLLIGTPSVEGDSVIFTYEQRCGGDPEALCGSGGAFRMERGSDGWKVSEVLSGWIS